MEDLFFTYYESPYVINAIASILGVEVEDVEAVGWRDEWGTAEPRACAKLLENYGRARGRREGRSREKDYPNYSSDR